MMGVKGNSPEREYFKFPHEIHISLTNFKNQMRISWFTRDSGGESGVWYGTSVDNMQLFARAFVGNLSDRTGWYHTALLEDLEPDTVYYYYVGVRPEYFSDVYNFHTRKDTPTVNIVAFGDMGTQPRGDTSLFSVLRVRKLRMVETYPDLIIHAGDFMYPFGNYGMVSTWFDRLQTVGAYVPYMVTSGNRDDPSLLERFNMAYSEGVPHPQPDRHNYYYSFDYNSVHFIFISTNFDAFTHGSHQYEWIKKDIEAAKERIADPSSPVQWIILVGHTPMYSSSNGHEQGNHELRAAVEGLIEPVTLCVWGDDHVYERSWPLWKSEVDLTVDPTVFRGRPHRPIHITAGTGGIDNDGWAIDQPTWSAVRWIGKGYLDIVADDEKFEVKFVDRDRPVDNLVDHFVIHLSTTNPIPIYIFMVFILVPVGVGLIVYSRGNKRVWPAA
jgi:hypothetical protein